MAGHESISKSDEWYTPTWLFKALGIYFDLDPCCADNSPAEHWCTNREYTDGLGIEWSGSVWLNPPFGGRNGIRSWLQKLAEHGSGIALVPNRTGADWWQDYAQDSSSMLFVRGKIKFLRPDGTEGKSPGYGNVLMAWGPKMSKALEGSSIIGVRA